MKTSRSIVNSRRERILETVRNGGDVSVNSLSEQLQVSPLTIRRDLQYLEEHKLLERFCGGSTPEQPGASKGTDRQVRGQPGGRR